jgi:hypothetical protein
MAANAAAWAVPWSTMMGCSSLSRSPSNTGSDVTAGASRVPCVDGRGDGLLACDQLLELGQVGRAERDIGARGAGDASRPVHLRAPTRVDQREIEVLQVEHLGIPREGHGRACSLAAWPGRGPVFVRPRS